MDLTVVSPKEATFECRIAGGEPRAKVTWYKDAREISESDKYEMTFYEDTASLTVKNTDIKDAGKYKCDASNKHARVETKCNLTVHSKPVITYEDTLKEVVTLKAGASLALPVNVKGLPTPSVKWFCKDTEIYSGGNVTIETSEGASRVVVKGVSGKDSGKYKIVAENKCGKDEAEFEVVVLGKFDL